MWKHNVFYHNLSYHPQRAYLWADQLSAQVTDCIGTDLRIEMTGCRLTGECVLNCNVF